MDFSTLNRESFMPILANIWNTWTPKEEASLKQKSHDKKITDKVQPDYAARNARESISLYECIQRCIASLIGAIISNIRHCRF